MNKFVLLGLFFLGSCAQLNNQLKGHIDKPVNKKSTFRTQWIKNLDPVYNTGNKPIGTSSPFIFEDIVYMGNMDGVMRAYNLGDGSLLWERSERFPIQAMVNKLGKNIVYGTQSGRVFSRNYLTGKLNYSLDLEAPIESQAVFGKGRMFFHLRNHTIIALDASSGKVFWRYRRSVPFSTTLQRVSKVLPFNNNLIVGFADGSLVSLSMEEGVVKWEQRLSTGIKFVDVDVTPLYFHGKIVAGSAAGPMRFVDPRNGAITKTVDFFQSHTPIIDNGNLIVGSIFGVVYRVDKYGKILAKKKISKKSISSIVKWKGGYAISTMGKKIHFVKSSDFSGVDEFNLGASESAIFGSLQLSEGYLALTSSRNRLYIFK